MVKIIENKTEEQQKAQAKAKQQLARQERRMGEIDGIIKRLYEDNVAGKLTDERFAKLSGDYEQEQAQLRASAAELRRTVEAGQEQESNAKQFLKLARSYIVLDELTPAMLHALVDKIIIHAPDKSTGHCKQQIDICYNFVGTFHLSHETATRETDMTAAGTKETA